MTNEIVTKTKWFWAWQDEKEETWLTEMAHQGLHLDDVPFPGRYQFKSGEPADYVYRLDYLSLKTKKQGLLPAAFCRCWMGTGWRNGRMDVFPV